MLNFICGGLLGDFIQCLFVVKNLCQIHNTKANLYITNNLSFGGDTFMFNIEQTFNELYPIIKQQTYIHDFRIYTESGQNPTNLINLNLFRQSPKLFHNCWSDILQSTFNFQTQSPYQWVSITDVIPDYANKVIIHRSMKRHNLQFPWKQIISQYGNDLIFITNNVNEYINFQHKNDVKHIYVENLFEFYKIINSCRFFIGNQSCPFAIASSLDKLRCVELDTGADRFSYIGEEKYTTKINWFYTNDNKYLTNFL